MLQCLVIHGPQFFFLLAALRTAQSASILVTRGDFEVFRPQGRHIAWIRVKFSMEESTFGRLLHVKFQPGQ